MTANDASARDLSLGVTARLRRAAPLDGRDARWLGLALVPGVVAVAVYLTTNPYPAYGGGLYARIAAAIAANGYAPPTTVDGYAVTVPFAYPPLQFYVFALALDLGFDPVTVTRFLPSVAVVAALVPAYLLGRDYTGSRAAGTGTAAMIALNPQVLEWHVSAGGVVRGFAFLYALTAVYAGYHVFTGGGRRALLGGAVAVALTGLTHPTYALFVVAGYLVLWGGLDRSLGGLARGLAVGLGALALASPWLAWVVATHGAGAFTAAAGTHGGLGGGLGALLAGPSWVRLVPLALAGAALALRRDATVAAWVVVATLLFFQVRFAYAVAALAVAVAGVGVAARLARREGSALATPDRRAAAAAALVLLATVAGGTALAAATTSTTDGTTPSFLDDESVAAAEWAAAETPTDARFLVLGDAAEWFPVLSGRSIAVGPWGVEWVSAAAYDRHLAAFRAASTCNSAACVESAVATVGADPDYVVVPKGRYTVRGTAVVGFGTLERSFAAADGWTRVHENDGVAVYRASGRADG
ncbi:glycosyltransferase family 39 protein [Halosimplex pelagicum]|uniref:Glycosyltransferase family 39 protein n=1 Tax=Halosimplex pelagicum TaxID=869886 RepID=A0A7D5T1C8_9EURY|nr:glycosyltransferase family 39 protein [Halosimplex pelagicum]QLH80291.1 glycosyltransferase family 39 protein [Halosimplex pelagicum]